MRRLNYRQCTACGTTFALPDKQRWCGFCERGFTAGLDAAREAVEALDIGRDVRFSVDVKADVLAAIDALRGQR